MVAGLGNLQVGQVLAATWQLQKDKSNAAIARGDVIMMNGSQDWLTATNAGINVFSVSPNAQLAADLKVTVLPPGSVVAVDVVSAGTATPGKEAVISATPGKIQDRVAEAANKVVGVILGTEAHLAGTTDAPITGPNPVYIMIQDWRIV